MAIKKVTWAEITLRPEEVVGFINTYNFQPGKFFITPTGETAYLVRIIYVKEEK